MAEISSVVVQASSLAAAAEGLARALDKAVLPADIDLSNTMTAAGFPESAELISVLRVHSDGFHDSYAAINSQFRSYIQKFQSVPDKFATLDKQGADDIQRLIQSFGDGH